VALVRWGAATLAYAANEDDDSLHTIDVDAGKERATTRLSGSPSQLLVLGDGRVAVTLRDANRVQILEPTALADQPLTSLCTFEVATEPVGLAATPDDRQLVVTSAWGKRLASYDTATMAQRLDVGLPREARAVVVDDSGDRAFVAHVVGATMSVVDLASSKAGVRAVSLGVKKQKDGALDPKPQSGCQGFALAKSISTEDGVKGEDRTVKAVVPKAVKRPATPPAGDPKKPDPETETAAVAPAPMPHGRIFAPMVTVDPGEQTQRSSGYGSGRSGPTEMPMVSVVDAAAERAITRTVMGEDLRRARECLLPRSATFVAKTDSLLVTCLGIDTVVELDARGLDPSRLERRRWRVAAGPTGVAVDAEHARAVVWSQFDRTASVIDLGGKDAAVNIAVTRRPDSRMTTELALGRKLFHRSDDLRISGDGRACASCHPDGREDALTWSTPDGPRQTIMLAGRATSSEPFGWSGDNPTLRDHVAKTFERLGGKGLKQPAADPEFKALLAYVAGMRAPSTGTPPSGERGELAKHGRELFFGETQGCASCHVGGAGTDRQRHDVGSRGPAVGSPTPIDTPSLRFVSGTAPYFHDGRFSTLEELLASPDHAMGRTLHLSHQDREALAAYMETL